MDLDTSPSCEYSYSGALLWSLWSGAYGLWRSQAFYSCILLWRCSSALRSSGTSDAASCLLYERRNLLHTHSVLGC